MYGKKVNRGDNKLMLSLSRQGGDDKFYVIDLQNQLKQTTRVC